MVSISLSLDYLPLSAGSAKVTC